MKRYLALLITIVLLSTLSFAALAEAPVRGGSITIGKTTKLTGFNPAVTSSRVEDGTVYRNLFGTLVSFDETGNYAPGLATSWTTSEDGLTFTMALREGVSFHCGEPFNAQAVKANLDWALNPDTGHVYLKSELSSIESVEVVDEYTVALHLSNPDAALPSVFSGICGTMLCPDSIANGDLTTTACGTGPFKLAEYVQGDHITLIRNENYYEIGEDGQPLPYLDEVVYRLMTDESVKIANLQSGDIDMVDYHGTSNNVLRAKEMDNLTTMVTGNRQTYFLSFNLNDERLSNVKIRQALSYAVNREELMEVVFEGLGIVAPFDSTPDQWFYSDYTPYSYDPAKAKELLTEAGYPDGITLTLSYIAREPDATTCQLLQEQVKTSGITLELEPMERLAWIEKIKTNRSGELGTGLIAIQGLDPNQQYNSTLAYCDPKCVTEIQEYLLSAKKVSDQEARKEILVTYQQRYLDAAYYVILGQNPRYVSYSNQLCGLSFRGDGTHILTSAYLTAE